MPSIRNYEWKDIFTNSLTHVRQLFSLKQSIQNKENALIVPNPLFRSIVGVIKSAGIDRESLYPKDLPHTDRGAYITSMATQGTGVGEALKHLFERPSSLLLFPVTIKLAAIAADTLAQLWRLPVEMAAQTNSRFAKRAAFGIFTVVLGGWALNLVSAAAKFLDSATEKMVNKPVDKFLLGEKALAAPKASDIAIAGKKELQQSVADFLKNDLTPRAELRRIIELTGDAKAEAVKTFYQKWNLLPPKKDNKSDPLTTTIYHMLNHDITDEIEQNKLKAMVLPNADLARSVKAYQSYLLEQKSALSVESSEPEIGFTSESETNGAEYSGSDDSDLSNLGETTPLFKSTYHFKELARHDLKKLRVNKEIMTHYHDTQYAHKKERGQYCIPALADKLLRGNWSDEEKQQLEQLITANPRGRKGRYQIVENLDQHYSTTMVNSVDEKQTEHAKIIAEWLTHRPLPKRARLPFMLLIHGMDKEGHLLNQNHREKAVSMIADRILQEHKAKIADPAQVGSLKLKHSIR